jgi:pimeloyl-ACP methyl ester carboxylesterase
MRWLALICLFAATSSAKPSKERWETLPLPPEMPAANDHGEVDSKGAKIYYATYGKGTAPVILLHGGLGNSDHWSNQLPALVDKYKVIAIDSRGQGRSTRTKTTITYDLMAEDVVAVMDALDIKKASVVGWSDGGEVALKLGIAHADRVDKLFVFGANYNYDGNKSGGSKSATFQGYAVKCKQDYEKISKTPKEWSKMVDWLMPLWQEPMGFTKKQLQGISAPVMMADGDHDEVIVLDQVKEMAKLIPHAQLKVFADASHFALWQDPDDFNQAVVDFLGS